MLRSALAKAAGAAPVVQAVIDAPTEAAEVDRFAFLAVGWAWAGDPHQLRIAAIEAWGDGTLLGEANVLDYRPDVCAALGLPPIWRTGFRIVASHRGAPRGGKFEIEIRVRWIDGTRTAAIARRTVASLGASTPALRLQPTDEEVRAAASATGQLPLPPDHLQARQIGGVWGDAFYREGRVMLNQIRAAFAAAGEPLETCESVLDFGCGCGRVLGGFVDFSRRPQLCGCDIDAEAIAWNSAWLPGLASFACNAVMPPTPFSTGQFDGIYSVSVFTHLPEEMQFAWLTELRRILRPGGLLVASVHGGKYAAEGPLEVRDEIATRGFAYRTGAVTEGLPDFYMMAMHAEPYIRAKWSRFFEVVAVHERLIHGHHDGVVLRRPAD